MDVLEFNIKKEEEKMQIFIKERVEPEKIKKQQQRINEAKCEFRHPYLHTIHQLITNLDLARICLNYIPEKLCICGNFYYGSMCVICGIKAIPKYDNSYREIDRYKINGELKLVHSEYDFDYNICCFAPTHDDDVLLMRYWHNSIRNLNYENERNNWPYQLSYNNDGYMCKCNGIAFDQKCLHFYIRFDRDRTPPKVVKSGILCLYNMYAILIRLDGFTTLLYI